jgi:hypothetical protein
MLKREYDMLDAVRRDEQAAYGEKQKHLVAFMKEQPAVPAA